MRKIEVVDYNPLWPKLFNAECAVLYNQLEGVAIAIHHIGSTAVPGLAAKPVIDILIEVTGLKDLDALNNAMEDIGYEAKGENGISGRRYFQKGGDDRTHHIHAFAKGDPNITRHLSFRDYLRSNRAIANEYAELKMRIAKNCGNDSVKYCEGKDSFVKKHESLALKVMHMQGNTLIDKYLPEYTFNEYHETVVDSPIENVYEVAKNIDLSKSKIIKYLFKIRGLPTKRLNLKHFIDDIGFTNLEENFPYENLIGFWARSKIAKIESYEDFIHNSISPRIKAVWNFQFEKIEGNKTKVSTETRVLCVAEFSRITFGAYWRIIKPFSGLIRIQMLKIIKNESESTPRN